MKDEGSPFPVDVIYTTRGINGRFIKETVNFNEALDRLFKAANEKIVTFNKVKYGEIPDKQAEEAKKSARKHNIKLDINGFGKVIDSEAIRHMINQHGDPATEQARGQIAITKDDIVSIPEITANPDSVEYAGKTRKGQDLLLYTKRINGEIYYYEEVRTGQKELAAKTLYKKVKTIKEGQRYDAMPHEETSSQTSETLTTPPSYTYTIPYSDDGVNEEEV
ncbi:MAG: hypothetical protein H7843_04025 [Nitrospirota bacterium]